jgi:hypothetical protein
VDNLKHKKKHTNKQTKTMINFNDKDDNMEAVEKYSKLGKLATKNEYRVYGLAQDGNPPFLFSAQESTVNAEQEKAIIGFLKTNAIDCAMEDCETKDKKVYIGLRRDLRDNPELCGNFIQTFVYFLENRLELSADFKIAGIPSFKTEKV